MVWLTTPVPVLVTAAGVGHFADYGTGDNLRERRRSERDSECSDERNTNNRAVACFPPCATGPFGIFGHRGGKPAMDHGLYVIG